jgi:hypothetical protein
MGWAYLANVDLSEGDLETERTLPMRSNVKRLSA